MEELIKEFTFNGFVIKLYQHFNYIYFGWRVEYDNKLWDASFHYIRLEDALLDALTNTDPSRESWEFIKVRLNSNITEEKHLLFGIKDVPFSLLKTSIDAIQLNEEDKDGNNLIFVTNNKLYFINEADFEILPKTQMGC